MLKRLRNLFLGVSGRQNKNSSLTEEEKLYFDKFGDYSTAVPSEFVEKFHQKNMSKLRANIYFLALFELLMAVRFTIAFQEEKSLTTSSKPEASWGEGGGSNPESSEQSDSTQNSDNYNNGTVLSITILGKAVATLVLLQFVKVFQKSMILLQAYSQIFILLSIVLTSEVFLNAAQESHFILFWLGAILSSSQKLCIGKVQMLKMRLPTQVIILTYFCIRFMIFSSYFSDCFILYFVILYILETVRLHTKRQKNIRKLLQMHKHTQKLDKKDFYRECLRLALDNTTSMSFSQKLNVPTNNQCGGGGSCGGGIIVFEDKQKGKNNVVLHSRGMAGLLQCEESKIFDSLSQLKVCTLQNPEVTLTNRCNCDVHIKIFNKKSPLSKGLQQNMQKKMTTVPSDKIESDHQNYLEFIRNNITMNCYDLKEVIQLLQEGVGNNQPNNNNSLAEITMAGQNRQLFSNTHRQQKEPLLIDCEQELRKQRQTSSAKVNKSTAIQNSNINNKVNKVKLEIANLIQQQESQRSIQPDMLGQVQAQAIYQTAVLDHKAIQITLANNNPLQQQYQQLRTIVTMRVLLRGQTYLAKVVMLQSIMVMSATEIEEITKRSKNQANSPQLNFQLYQAEQYSQSQHRENQRQILCIILQEAHKDLELEEKDKQLQQFKNMLAHTSHEFRTPLNCSIAMLEKLASFINGQYKVEYLEPAINSQQLLLNLINDILDFSQISAGKFSLNFQKFKVRKIVSFAAKLISIQAELKKIEIIQEIDKKVPLYITNDPNRFRQVILNLLSNSLKFTKKGYIKVSVSVLEEAPLTLRVVVKDTGIGMSAEQQMNLFQAFGKIRTGEHTKMNAQGVGLGLHISNSLTKSLGGEGSTGMSVSSKEGEGSEFSFDIVDKLNKDYLQLVIESDENINSSQSDIEIADYNKQFIQPKSMIILSADEYLNPLREEECGKLIRQQYTQKTHSTGADQKRGSLKLQNHNSGSNAGSSLMVVQFSKQISSTSINQVIERSQSINSEKLIKSFDVHNDGFTACQCCHTLVVDDNQFNVLVFLKSFDKYLPKMESCFSGEDAIEKIRTKLLSPCCKNYKIIFMDIEMPGKNGYQTTKEIRELYQANECNHYAIVACTGYDQDQEQGKLNSFGFKYFLKKPVQKKNLKKLLKQIIEDKVISF